MSVPPLPLSPKNSERAYRPVLEEAPIFPGTGQWKYLASCHMLEGEHSINQPHFSCDWKATYTEKF